MKYSQSIQLSGSYGGNPSPDAVYNGIVAGSGLGKASSPDGVQRCEALELEQAHAVDDQIGCPRHEPQRDGDQSNLGQFTLSALLGILGRAQRLDIHLLGLFAHGFLVGRDGLWVRRGDSEKESPNAIDVSTTYGNDEPVGVADQEQWDIVDKDRVEDQI